MHSFGQLVQSFEERFLNTLPFPQTPDNLYEPCRYLLKLGGKRVRPVLCLMSNELFGDIIEDAWHAAAAVELFHNFTLIHDDIMDKAPLRRGQPTIHAKYGLTAGILCGDIMNIYSYEQLGHITRSLPQILQLFNKTAIEVCEGQQMDMDFETRDDVHIDEYIQMITLKTSVLLACSLKIGGLLGGSTEGNANKLYAFGKNLGIAFQLADDILDYVSDESHFGKTQGTDLREGKLTLQLITALRYCNQDERRLIKDGLIAESLEEARLREVMSIINRYGGIENSLNLAKSYVERAKEALHPFKPSMEKEALKALANYVIDRKQ